MTHRRLLLRLLGVAAGLLLVFSVIAFTLLYHLTKEQMIRHNRSSIEQDCRYIAELIGERAGDNTEFLSPAFFLDIQDTADLLENLTRTQIFFAAQDGTLLDIHGRKPLSSETAQVARTAFSTINAALNGQILSSCIQTRESYIILGAAPLLNSSGQIVGAVLIAGLEEDFVLSRLIEDQNMPQTLFALMAMVLVIVLVTTCLIVKPMEMLHQQALAMAAETQNIFFSKISHELKTPVSVLRASLENLTEDVLKTEQDRQAYYLQMLSQIIWLQKLIQDLLDLTRLKTAEYQLNIQPTDCVELLGDVLMSARILANKQGISIACPQPQEECIVPADYDRIRQLLMILVDNALKFSQPGTTLHLRLDCRQKCFTVQDEGCGIPEEIQDQIFEVHFRQKSLNRDGSGLGLAIARQIALRHGFYLGVKSVVGKGSTFYLQMK